MNDPLYLFSAVDTLTYASVSVHDLLDAYATFTNRVILHAHLLQGETPPPAMTLLRTHKDDLVRALRRDVRRALIGPLDLSFEGAKIVSEQDASWLCHHALCALTTIFQFPAFHSVFSGMFTGITCQSALTLCRARSLILVRRRSRSRARGMPARLQGALSLIGCPELPSSPSSSTQPSTR